jgi:hypothetical protein
MWQVLVNLPSLEKSEDLPPSPIRHRSLCFTYYIIDDTSMNPGYVQRIRREYPVI